MGSSAFPAGLGASRASNTSRFVNGLSCVNHRASWPLHAQQLCWRAPINVKPFSRSKSLRRQRSAGSGCTYNSETRPMAQAQQSQTARLRRRACSLAPTRGTAQLSFLTFNVLADGLAQEGGFIRAPKAALEWEQRRGLLLAEIADADADVICLQEVNRFDDFFQPELAALGYTGHFYRKPQSPGHQSDFPAHGSALFYRTSRLQAVQPPQGRRFVDAHGGEAAQGMLTWRLRDGVTGRQLLVATVHLKAKGGAANEHVRLHQAQQAVKALAEAAASADPACGGGGGGARNGSGPASADQQSSSGNGSHPPEQPGVSAAVDPGSRLPVVLCGDMNAEPQSPPCQMLREHPLGLRSLWDVVPAAAAGAGGAGSGPAVEEAAGGTDAAAEATAEAAATEEQLITTWKFRADGESRRVIDYIWHTPELQPVSRWLTPSPEDIGQDALPSLSYGSDHLACLAALEWDS